MVALRKTERGPTPLFVFPKEFFMPTRDGEGPIWPVSVNTVRLTLQRSRLDTLRKPDIAIIQRSDHYGWVRYAACVADSTYHQFESAVDVYHAIFNAFCEPLSDFTIHTIPEGVLLSFTLYVNKPAARLRLRHMDMKWLDWAEKYGQSESDSAQ